MNIITAVYSAILFFILTPSVIVRLPSNGSKMTVAMVHASLFGIVLFFTQEMVNNLLNGIIQGKRSPPCALPKDNKNNRGSKK